jgi:hypothetical protein
MWVVDVWAGSVAFVLALAFGSLLHVEEVFVVAVVAVRAEVADPTVVVGFSGGLWRRHG